MRYEQRKTEGVTSGGSLVSINDIILIIHIFIEYLFNDSIHSHMANSSREVTEQFAVQSSASLRSATPDCSLFCMP